MPDRATRLRVAVRRRTARSCCARSTPRPRGAARAHYFPLVRELSLQAYFSSEIGMTKALRYIMVPGKWVGCVPLKPGQPAWAMTTRLPRARCPKCQKP